MSRLSLVVLAGMLYCLVSCGQDRVCAPGLAQRCPCPGGLESTQSCLGDGSGWGPCACSQVALPSAESAVAVAQPVATEEAPQAQVQAQGQALQQGLAAGTGDPAMQKAMQEGLDQAMKEAAAQEQQKALNDPAMQQMMQEGLDQAMQEAMNQANQQPGIRLTQVSPPIGVTTGGETVTILGQGFAPGEHVFVFFGSARGVQPAVVSPTTIRVITPAVSQPGVVDVRVKTSTGKEASLKQAFRYITKSTMDIRDLGKR